MTACSTPETNTGRQLGRPNMNHCAADEEIDDEHHQKAAAHADSNAVNARCPAAGVPIPTYVPRDNPMMLHG